jgi:membrane protease YdiL (CAAX protease family)
MTAGPSKTGLVLRMVVYFVLAYVALIVCSTVLYTVTDTLISAILSVTAAATIANVITLRIFERGNLADVGLAANGASLRHFAIGLGLAVAGATLIIGVPAALGLADWQPVETPVSWSGVLYTLLLIWLGALGEELFFRGYGFQVALPVLGDFAALLPMSVLFAAAHSSNLSVDRLALFNTFAWGVLLGWAVLRSGALWLAIGLHAGWNSALPLLGVNLSGFTMKLSGFDLRWSIDDRWSGGSYGPEGGLLCTAIVALLAVVLWRVPISPQRLRLRRADESVD